MSISGIQGQILEVTVVGCKQLKDTEWISRQDPYVCLEYGSTKFRTRTHTDGGKNPAFQEKFTFTLIEGLRELNVIVWNRNTLTLDDFIGSGTVQLQKVVSGGYDDSSWPLQTKSGRHAGEVRVILHYANANKPATSYAPSAPPNVAPSAPQVSISMYSTPPPASSGFYPPNVAPSAPQVSMYSTPPPASSGFYPPSATAYPPPPSSYACYQQNSSPYPSTPYTPSQPPAYPPPYPPPSAYPPPPYPPPPQSSSYYPPPSPFPGIYTPSHY